MRRVSLKTHEDLLGDLVNQCQLILDEIEIHQKQLKLDGRTSDADKYFRTLKVMKKWTAGMGIRY